MAKVGQLRDDDADGLTIDGLLNRAARLWPERTAYVCEENRLSWSGLAEEVDRYARAFLAWGVQPGDRVSLWMSNSLSWVLVELGLIRIGAVVVPVNTGFTVAEAAYVVGQSDSVLLVVDSTLRGRDLADEAQQVAASAAVSVREVIAVGTTQSPLTELDQLLETAATVSSSTSAARASQVLPTDVMLMLYTSGTTGFPKAVMHSHKVIGNMTDAAHRLRLCEQDVAVMYLPLFHIFAFASTITFMARGAALVLMDVFRADESLELMERERATVAYGVAPHYLDQIRDPSFADRDLSSLRLCLAPGSADLVRIVSANMGPAVSVYGMTETTSMTSLGDVDDPLDIRAETVGRTLPRSQVKIVDEFNQEVEPGTVGQLLVKGPPVMHGYYKMPEATAEAIVNGWFHTGDAVSVDQDGYMRFAGRIKEMYKVGGENVDPIEVESALMRHPAVALASVQGVPDERLGEIGIAHVTLVAGQTVDEEQLRRHARLELASFKVPRHVDVVEQLPMTASGKVRKFILKQQFLARND